MATSTFGTSTANNNGVGSATTMTALQVPGSFTRQDGVVFSSLAADADIASIQQLIKDDFNPTQPINLPMGGWSKAGQLFIPNRGWLKVFPGDWVAVDNFGWPILVSGRSIAQANWSHNP